METVYEQIFGGSAFGLCGAATLEPHDEIVLMMNARNDNPVTADELRRQSRKIRDIIDSQNWKEFEKDWKNGETPWK